MTSSQRPPLFALTDSDPTRIGSFDIHGRLGAGGMGVVYGGTDGHGRWVALKLIRGEFADDPEFRDRFAREVELMRRVGSRCIAPVIAADTTRQGQPWYASPYVAGPTLHHRVKHNGALEPGLTQGMAVGLAEAIAAIHAAGVVHRDLKPANVILAADGPKVLDFGIARAVDESAITRTGGVVGSPGWMSPERFRGHTGPEADVFAWGALVAYAATGRAPFGTGTAETLMYRVLNEHPDLTGLPTELAESVTRALAKDPAARPGSTTLVPMVATSYGHTPDSEAADTAATIINHTWTPRPPHRDARTASPGPGPSPAPPGSPDPARPPTPPTSPPPNRVPGPAVPPPIPPAARPRPRARVVIPAVLGALVVIVGVGLAVPNIVTRSSPEGPPDSDTTSGSTSDASHPALAQLAEEDVLHIGIAEAEPYSYLDDSGEATGRAPEVARSVFEELGVTDVEASAMEFSALETALVAQEVDVAASDQVITPERCESVVYSEPYAQLRTGFMARDDGSVELSEDGDPGFAEIADAGLELGVVAGTPEEQWAQDEGVDTGDLTTADTSNTLLEHLVAGDVDVIAGDSIFLRWQQEQHPDGDDLSIVGSYAPPDPDTGHPMLVALAFSQENSDLAAAANERLNELTDSEMLGITEEFGMTEDELPPPDLTAEDVCSDT